jgi:hypothetical protein
MHLMLGMLMFSIFTSADEFPIPAVVSSDYPRVFFFRAAESYSTPHVSYEDWRATFGSLQGMEGKALNESLPGRESRAAYYIQLKKEQPEQLVLLHFNGNARDPVYEAENFFAGHWIYDEAAVIRERLYPTGTVIRVSDTSTFQTNIGIGGITNSQIVLYNVVDGHPDWENSEQVELISVDTDESTITVKRGCFGTSAVHDFLKNNGRAAAHKYEGPWGGSKSSLLWVYNYSTECPTNALGKNCANALVDYLSEKLRRGTDLGDCFDGIEFDVANGSNSGDMDGDGMVEDGIIDGINTYGLGVIEFYKKLRAALGKERLILADGQHELKQRGFGVLNGIESEGWPTHFDEEIEGWSGGLNRQMFWHREAAAPVFNYIKYGFGDEVPASTRRLVLAAAQFCDAAVCCTDDAPPEPGELVGTWDEMKKGIENQLGWLRQPQGAAVHLAEQTADLLDGTVLTSPIVSNGNLIYTQSLHCAGSDLLVVVRASADPLTGYPESYARLMRATVSGQSYSSYLLEPMSWVGSNEFESTFYFRGLADSNVSFALEIEGTNAVTIHSMSAYDAPDVMVRVFENGLILANPSQTSYTFDLDVLTPGRTYRRLNASSEQDATANNGTAVGGQVTLGGVDGLFLIRTDIETRLVSDSFSATELDPLWTADLNALITVSEGSVLLENGGTNTGRRAFIRRNTDSADATQFNSSGLFDFYDHGVTMNVELGNLGGVPAEGKRISYFMGISYDETGYEMIPAKAQTGVFFAIQKLNSVAQEIFFRLVVVVRKDGTTVDTNVIGQLSGAPSRMEVALKDCCWDVFLTDASFVSDSHAGSSRAVGCFEELHESDFTDFYFSTGVAHEGPAAEAGSMELSSIKISTSIP